MRLQCSPRNRQAYGVQNERCFINLQQGDDPWRAVDRIRGGKKAERNLRGKQRDLGQAYRRMNMKTSVAAMTPADDRRRKAPRPDLQRTAPQAGDILVAERSARADMFSISTIPTDSDIVVTRYAEAIERVQQLARTRRVDGWYTRDHTHYARVASYRP